MNENAPALFSSWTPRIAVFSGALVVTAVLLHRLLGMPTPLALNLFGVALGLAGLAMLLGMIALGDVWRRGAEGTAGALMGMLLAGSVFAWPLAFLPAYVNLPAINDATTSLTSPPRFNALAKERERAGLANPVLYPSEQFAELQKAAYPDLRPLLVNRPLDDTYEMALETLKRLRFQIVAETPPRQRQAGLIEAVDRTMVIGFYDDVVLRVEPDGARTRVDVRSASRFGQHDLGRNSSRVRRVLSELQARIDASVLSPGQRFARIKSTLNKGKSQVKKGKGDPKSAARNAKGRAPVPKATPARVRGPEKQD